MSNAGLTKSRIGQPSSRHSWTGCRKTLRLRCTTMASGHGQTSGRSSAYDLRRNSWTALSMLIVEQMLNGLQLGMMLFLIAAGLTLVFGIMNLVNLAHGALYMIGAYVWASTMTATGSFLLAVTASLTAAAAVGVAIELTVFRELYRRDHLDQVLATFGLIIFFNEAVRMIWGAPAIFAP